jgi:acyl carrier protein
MGTAIIELVNAVERSFELSIPDRDAERMVTVCAP